MYKVKENFENETIDEMLSIYEKVKGPITTTGKGLVGNSHYIFTGTSAVDCVQDGKNFYDANNIGVSGSDLQKLTAKGLMKTFQISLGGMAKQINLQHTGDELE